MKGLCGLGEKRTVMDDSDGSENDSSPYYDADPETGRIKSKYSDDDFVQAIETLGYASTGDVAAEVGCDRTTALQRLEQLADDGRIEKLESGSGFHWKPGVENSE